MRPARQQTNPNSLRFVRFEPCVVPKVSLTGGSAERVDARVFQAIFSFERGDQPIYVGQQMDVYIDAEPQRATTLWSDAAKP